MIESFDITHVIRSGEEDEPIRAIFDNRQVVIQQGEHGKHGFARVVLSYTDLVEIWKAANSIMGIYDVQA